MYWQRIFFTLMVGLLVVPLLHAQRLPIGQQFSLPLERYLSESPQLHSALRPGVYPGVNFDTIDLRATGNWERKQYTSFFGRKLRNENLVEVDTNSFKLVINPLSNIWLARDREDTLSSNYFLNTRGFELHGQIGRNFYFESSFYENQGVFPRYISNFIAANDVAPGAGRVKLYRETGYDFAMASGTISYNPSDHFNFQFGHGKNFIGEGYRSLMLSDNTFNYPFLRITTTFGKGRFQYTNLYTFMQSVDRVPAGAEINTEPLFQRKAGSFHYLSWAPADFLQIGLFEGFIWQRWDSTGTKDFDENYLNPVIGVNALTQGLNDKNNGLLGLNAKVVPLKHIVLYGQYIYDKSDRSGFQTGVKWFDVLGVTNLTIRGEYNTVDNYTYGHGTTLQNYAHYNQALAHPLGAGFSEVIGSLHYRWRDFYGEYQLNLATYNVDFSGFNVGTDIFVSDTAPVSSSATIEDGQLSMHRVQGGYIINPKTNLQVFGAITSRVATVKPISAITDKTLLVQFGVRTNLANAYYDF